MPSKRSGVERLNFCRWVDAEDPWIDREVWAECQRPKLSPKEERQGKFCWLALDLASKTDLAAGVVVWDMETHLEAEVIIWTPRDTIHQRSESDGVPYEKWAEQGHIILTPGKTIPFDFIARWIQDITGYYLVGGLGYDPWRIDEMERALDEYGIETCLLYTSPSPRDS